LVDKGSERALSCLKLNSQEYGLVEGALIGSALKDRLFSLQ